MASNHTFMNVSQGSYLACAQAIGGAKFSLPIDYVTLYGCLLSYTIVYRE